MKKKVITIVIIVILLLSVLLLPARQISYEDGGTREYAALTYKIVKWNRFIPVYDTNGKIMKLDTYTNTSVYYFPDNYKSIDELWEIELTKVQK